ncbi:MAG: sulfate ABC transporter permease subunit CysT [Anaerolineales bacterium]|nr:sulfate ABC transporter permease subunit CysT [Anaerolineales bacterium]
MAKTRSRKAGIGLRVGVIVYLVTLVILPILVIVWDGLREGLDEFWHQISLPIAWHALKLTFLTSGLMVVVNVIMGTLIAYVLVRYDFGGKRLLNAVIDLPLAIPTLVTGVMLVILYGPQQVLGAWLKDALGLSIIFAPPGIVLALLFITLPFVVRSVQPVLQNLDRVQEDAAATLGASRWMIFRRIVLPALLPAILSGALLSFSRAIGEFGSVVIVAGNIPLYSQTAAVYVFGEVESENRLGASAVSLVLILVSFTLMLLVNRVQKAMHK